MPMTRVRLQHRIVLPFAAIALLAIGATAFTARYVTSRLLRARVESQLVSAARILSQSDMALNAAIIRSASAITANDIVTFTGAGRALSSTLDERASASIVRALRASSAIPAAPAAPAIARDVPCGKPCVVAYYRLAGQPDAAVAVIATTDDLVTATAAVTQTMVLAGVIGLVLMLIAANLVARRVTRPIDRLVAFAGGIADGDTADRAAVEGDEVGALARAFNEMLDRLSASRTALVRSEKLGLAGLIAARVAHDIRNPLASIKLQTQLLRARLQTTGDAQTLTSLEAVSRDVLQVESVVRDLLELARPGDLRRQPASISIVVGDILQQLAPHLAYRQIQVQTSLSSVVPSMALDVERFKQALLNIINNASDAMATGGTLSIASFVEGDHIRLDVCDDGPGVDPAVLPRVFDPFVSTKRDGVGLGLVNAKAVVEAHGGTIGLGPAAGRGTRVTIRLPLRTSDHG